MAWRVRALIKPVAVGSFFITCYARRDHGAWLESDNCSFEKTTSLIRKNLQKISPSPMRTYTACCKEETILLNSDSIADAAEEVRPAVVSIYAERHENGKFKGGTGFIVDKRGYIITTESVVGVVADSNVKSVILIVVLGDGRKFLGNVVAVDRLTALALIKVDTDMDLPEVRIGDDSKLRPGQWLVLVGTCSCTAAGIIHNAAFRSTDNEMATITSTSPKFGGSKYVLIDLFTHPGSNGGPFVNLAGEVAAVFLGTGIGNHNEHIQMGIPVSEVKRFLREYFHG